MAKQEKEKLVKRDGVIILKYHKGYWKPIEWFDKDRNYIGVPKK